MKYNQKIKIIYPIDPPQKPDLLPILKPDPPQKPDIPQKPDLPLKVSKPPQKPVLIMNNYRMSDKMKYSDRYFPPYTPHKLDFTCGDIMCDYFKAIHRLKRPTSGEQYKPDFDVLFNVIKLHQKDHIIPKDSDIVMHLRLGDVANSKCWEGIGCHFEFSKKCYEHMHIHPPPGHIVVVSSNKHLSANHRESDEYKNKVVNFLRNKGYSVTDRHDHTEEEDVIFMFNAKQFIPGGGGFSDLVKQMAKKNGAKIIENWKHHCNDPPQKPDVPLKVSTVRAKLNPDLPLKPDLPKPPILKPTSLPYSKVRRASISGCDSTQYAVPVDAQEHAQRIHSEMKVFFPKRYHTYRGYSGPWIENHWIDTFEPHLRSKHFQDHFGGFVPLLIPWTDMWVMNPSPYRYPPGFVETLRSLLRTDILYVTVSQNDEGLSGKCEWDYMPNILVMSAGGFGHVPIPLIMGELNAPPHPPTKSIDFVFLGTKRSIREKMCKVVRDYAAKHDLSTDLCRLRSNWTEQMTRSHVGMVPRGYGRSSYRLAETVQLGVVPWYVYDDVEWLPYRALWEEFGYSSSIQGLAQDLARSNFDDVRRKQARLAHYHHSHFTYNGVIEQIRRFITDRSTSDLQCQDHPVCPRSRECTCPLTPQALKPPPDPSMLKPAIGMVAVTSSNLVEMTHNWWHHLKKYKIPTTLVSLSPNLCEQFNDVKCVYATHLKTDQRQQVDYGTSEYNYNVKHKLDEFSNIFDNTKDGDIMLFSDVDIIYLSDPFHALPRDKGPLWFSDNNKKCNNRKDLINSGLFFVQKNDYTRNIFEQAKTALKDGKTYDGGDQGAFQTVLKNYKYSMLPCDTFINGAVFMNEKYNIHPVGIHLNWIAHSDEKISLMKKHGLWTNPPQKPIVHIFNANNGVGLGQNVISIVPVLYTLRNENYTHFNIHECGLNPPWRNAVPCEIRPKHVALFNNFKRTRGDYTKLKDTNQMEYFDGQKNWYEFLTSPSKPNTKMILIEDAHNRWRPHGFNDCDEIKYWFDEPVGHLLKLVQEPAQKIQTTITFHIRTFADERIGIAFNEDLTLNETLAKLERNYEKENEQRIQRVIDMQTQFPNMIQKLVDIADFIYEKTGKITHVAADSEVVRKYLRKYPFIHIITPGVLDYNKHFKTEPNYSLSEISDWYLLSLGKKIAVFPSGSTFSDVAQCRGGGKTTLPHKTEDMDVIFDNIKRQFQKNIELHVLDKDADFGAGFYMEGAAKIYEIADAAGIPSTSLHSCGTRNKPWHVTAMRCPKNHWHSAKRIKEMFKTLGPYQEIDDSKDFVHIDGQKQDWVKALQDLNPAKPTKVFLTEPHNKFIAFRYRYENRNCKGKKKWFGESIFEFPANIQNNVSFHLRFLTHEDYGIQISKNLSLHKVHRSNFLHDTRIDDQEINIPDVKQSVDIILQYADLMFKKTGKATFIATDSDNVRKYTRQYPYISIYNITHDNRDEHEIHFSKASMRDLYTLAQAKHIITFPFKSQFSATAACLGDGKQVVVHTLDKLKQELSKHMNELEKSADNSGKELHYPPIKDKDGTAAISHRRKIVFVHVPKTGGTTIEKSDLFDDALAHHNIGGHMKLNNILRPEIESYTRFAVVREPCERFISAFNYLKGGYGNVGDRDWWKENGISDIDEFVQNKLKVVQYIHFKPQIPQLLLKDGRFGIDVLLFTETMPQDLLRLRNALGLNESKLWPEALMSTRKNTHSHIPCSELNPSTRDAILAHYSYDSCVLGYKADGPIPTQVSKADYNERLNKCKSL